MCDLTLPSQKKLMRLKSTLLLRIFPLAIFLFAHFTSPGQDSTTVQKIKPHMFGLIYDVVLAGNSKIGKAEIVTMEYTNKRKIPYSVRVNVAGRFKTTGMQIETDAYPVINKKMYAYLNAGAADDILFPRYRTGMSLFRSLPAAFEIEGGFRFLYFTSPLWLYTASVGKYHKKYWFNLSTFLAKQNGLPIKSHAFKTRYYFNDKSYMMLTLGTGISPDDRRNNNQLNVSKNINTKRADLSFRLFLKKSNVLSFGTGFLRQSEPGKISSSQYNSTLGYYKIF